MSNKPESLPGSSALAEIPSRIDPQFINDPYPQYAQLRTREPVRFDPKLGMWLVSRYEDLQEVFRDPTTFSLEEGYKQQYSQGYFVEFKQILERDGGGYFPDAIMTDPPYHTGVRQLMDKAFTAHRVKQLEAAITRLVINRIEAVADQGRCEAVNDIAVPLTIEIICEQMGFEQVDADKIKRWSAAVVQQIGAMQSRDEMISSAREICELQHYIVAHIREREERPREDMISDLVHARMEDGSRLTFSETVSLVRAMLIAGNETTAAGISKLLLMLATRPDLAQELKDSLDDERLLSRFIEEFLRYDSPIHGLSRVTTKDVELGGVALPKGSQILLLYASGNRDGAEFPAADTFDPTRKNLLRHVTFGTGTHRCIGAALARMEIKTVAREIGRRFDNIRLAVPLDELYYIPSIATHSLASLPLTFSRRAA
jgi:cytochrome P450